MSCFKDVLAAAQKIGLAVQWLGCTPEFEVGVRQRINAIGNAICEERQISHEQLLQNDVDNELLALSQPLFDDLKRWIDEQPGGTIGDKRLIDLTSVG